MPHVLPSSPNWYCGSIVDIAEDKYLAYGARGDLNILQLNVNSSSGYNSSSRSQLCADGDSSKISTLATAGGDEQQLLRHPSTSSPFSNDDDTEEIKNEVSSINNAGDSNGVHNVSPKDAARKNDTELPATSSNIAATNNKGASFQHEGKASINGEGHGAADCVLITTISRIHKDKITAVRLLKQEAAISCDSSEKVIADDHCTFLLFTGADDGTVKHHVISWNGNAFNERVNVRSKFVSEHSLSKNNVSL